MSGDVLSGLGKMLTAWGKRRRKRADQAKRRRETCRPLGHVPGRPSNVCALCGQRLDLPGKTGLAVRPGVHPIVLLREGDGSGGLRLEREDLERLAESVPEHGLPVRLPQVGHQSEGTEAGLMVSAHVVGDELRGLVRWSHPLASGFPDLTPSFVPLISLDPRSSKRQPRLVDARLPPWSALEDVSPFHVAPPADDGDAEG